MAIQTDEWDRLVTIIKTFPQAYQQVAAIAFRMGHEEGWWLARTDPDSTVSPPEHEKKVNPFNNGVAKVTVEAYGVPAEPAKPNFEHADLCLGCPQCTNEVPANDPEE